MLLRFRGYYRFQGLGFIQILGFRVNIGFRVQDSYKFWISGLIWGFEFRVQGLGLREVGCRVLGFGCGVQGVWCVVCGAGFRGEAGRDTIAFKWEREPMGPASSHLNPCPEPQPLNS